MILNLETQQQEVASYVLSRLIEEATETHDRNLIRRIRRLWQFDCFGRGSRRGEKWKSILHKVACEGSTWYVWWMDGVRTFIQRKGMEWQT